MKEFIYQLILEDRLFQAENWTDQDEQHVSKHFMHLQSLLDENLLILAGKTAGLNNDTYGIVIFRAKDLKDAQAIVQSDPAVISGIMSAHLQEYNVALYNPDYKKE